MNSEKMELRPVSLREANEFIRAFHRHNWTIRGPRYFQIGLMSNEINLVGVAIVARPIARLLCDMWTAEILRVCVSPEAPRNANSKLYAACWRAWRAMGGRRLITYTLTTESGASLRGAGWKVMAQCKPGTWNRENRLRQWQPIYGQQKFRWERLS